MTYRFLSPARAEFDAAVVWYERRSPGLGDRFTDEVYAAVARIVAQPHAYGLADRAPAGREIRELKVRKFDYKIVYEVTPAEIVILGVTHARRRGQPWRRRLGPNP